jgi:hypothetical protein
MQLSLDSNINIINKLYYLYNNIINNIEQNLFKIKLNKYYLYIIIKDINIYSELKTNLGLFNIKKYFKVKLFFKHNNINLNRALIKNMKYIL